MTEDLIANPIPGEWYLGVPCEHCDEMVLVLPDISRGQGTISTDPRAPKDDILREPCIRGHVTRFRIDDLYRFQWYPRLNS